MKVLMVCTGNICRSVMAQVVLEHHAKGAVEVDSCGISNEEEGNPIDPRAAQVLRENGYQVPRHRARQIRPEDFDDFDLILAMTKHHFNVLETMADRYGKDFSKVKMFRQFDPDFQGAEVSAQLDVPDPWYGTYQDFVITLQTIEKCVPQILRD